MLLVFLVTIALCPSCTPSQSPGADPESPAKQATSQSTDPAAPSNDNADTPTQGASDTIGQASTDDPADNPAKRTPGEVTVPGSSASAWNTSQSDGKPDKGDRGIQDYQRIILQNRDKFRTCYEAAHAKRDSIRGKVTLVWVLDPKGQVRDGAHIEATSSDFYDEFLESCMVGALGQLTFPPSRRGMDSTVRYPFDFKPQGRAPN